MLLEDQSCCSVLTRGGWGWEFISRRSRWSDPELTPNLDDDAEISGSTLDLGLFPGGFRSLSSLRTAAFELRFLRHKRMPHLLQSKLPSVPVRHCEVSVPWHREQQRARWLVLELNLPFLPRILEVTRLDIVQAFGGEISHSTMHRTHHKYKWPIW